MLTVISPAKKLDWTRSAPEGVVTTEPDFLDQANILAGHARALSLAELKALMSLSDKLAQLNRDRFRDFSADPSDADTRPAALAFAGDTYTGLDAPSLDAEALDWAQRRLGILSGLYGLLRPLDVIQPYRLEMGSKLKSRRGGTLYAFWGDRLSKALNARARDTGSDAVLNCASQEYFRAVDPAALEPRVITPAFLEAEGDRPPRMISFHAKKARGALARWVIDNRVTDPADIAGFDRGGYALDSDRSEPDTPVFVRHVPARARADA